jgi:hypothetical protein
MADANMSDLDGQLMLLRVPAASPVPAAAPEMGSFQASPDRDGDEAEGAERGEMEAGNGTALGHPDYQGGYEGASAADRLREELKRVKLELQSLLTALAGTKGSAP